jgi:hypothetical protein
MTYRQKTAGPGGCAVPSDFEARGLPVPDRYGGTEVRMTLDA